MPDIDVTKLNVTKGNLQSANGFQPSVWDHFKDKFPKPGDILEFPKDADNGLTSQQASQLAKRMKVLYPDLHFHSGVNNTKDPKTVFVRRREEGWVPSAKDKEEEKKQKEEDDKEEGADPNSHF